MERKYLSLIVFCACLLFLSAAVITGSAQVYPAGQLRKVSQSEIQTGAERTGMYFPQLSGKEIGLVCNQTSIIGNTNLVDSLISAGFSVKAIFSPEHGFRGDNDAGANIQNSTDKKTGVKIISLYGKKTRPEPTDLKGIDILVFDIQDVGVRFYTYISTLSLVMEAAAETGIPLIILDRPNPNGFYVDGPVLDTAFHSFIGMNPVPIVYGMTIGEYAMMLDGEGWIGAKQCQLTIIPMVGYTHNMIVMLPVKPSPNLPNWQSVYLYPSLGLFEGTIISIGRGTEFPFQVVGHPDYLIGSFIFKPESIPGISAHPPYEGMVCTGANLDQAAVDYSRNSQHFSLEWLIRMHNYFRDSAGFFTSYFDKLAGTDQLRKDLINGRSETEIRRSWEKDLNTFVQIRKKYLQYPE